MSKNKVKEGDLYESSDPDIKYEENTTNGSARNNSRSGRRFRGSIWSLPATGYDDHKQSFINKFAPVSNSISIIFSKCIDFSRIFIYNLYCNKKHHERINTVKKTNKGQSVEKSKNSKNDSAIVEYSKAKSRLNSVSNGIMGIGLFLLVASEVLSTAIIIVGTEHDIVPKVIVAPIAIHAFTTLIKVFLSFTKGDK